MGHGHSHAGPPPSVEVGYVGRFWLLTALVLAGLATLVGLVVFWPDSSDVPSAQYSEHGVSSTDATVVRVYDPCPVNGAGAGAESGGSDGSTAPGEKCNVLAVRVDGRTVEIQAPPYVAKSGLRPGDPVRLAEVRGTEGGPTSYAFVGVDRELPLGILAAVFLVAVAVVARKRGLLAILGLGFAGLIMGAFMLPALLAGEGGPTVALIGSSAIMFVVLYLAHGVSIRTSTALAGTLVGIAITTVLALWVVDAGRMAGMGEQGEYLMTQAPTLDFRGLLTAAIIVAGLGVLNDVTITQSSAVWELRAAAPGLTRRELFASGMRIGRDHIASTIYTIVFAYAGTALTVLMLLTLFDRTLLESLTDEAIAEEAARTLATAIGLVLAVPATTAIAALTVSGPE